ncbi:hypothetical protein DY000_02029377 [Brassica cretica]|uniref:Uncharacterized protein n=1 Tax=Brassica cretica TaxID=69181 RepID=A0ABQ7DSI3_BRACR|nr:hypothetical protein DY000_02029377 [Brassica cretica]
MPPMRALALQCALIKPPFKIPMDPPLPLSGSLISRSLYIFFSLLPQIVKSTVLSWRKTLQIFPAKLLLLSSSDMFHQDPSPTTRYSRRCSSDGGEFFFSDLKYGSCSSVVEARLLIDVNDLEGEDVLKSEFCADVFDNVWLCYHIDEEYPVKAKNGCKLNFNTSTVSLESRDKRSSCQILHQNRTIALVKRHRGNISSN